MRFIDILVEEHKAVREILDVLDVICKKLQSGERIEPEHIEGIVDFIRNFADKAHHMKEEDLLFPALEGAGVPRGDMLVEALTTEHDLGRGYVRGIGDGLIHYSIGNNSGRLVIRENALKYIELMTRHIDKEEDVIFPLAQRYLSEAVALELAQEFERIDRDVIGDARREEFMSILRMLKETYLGGS